VIGKIRAIDLPIFPIKGVPQHLKVPAAGRGWIYLERFITMVKAYGEIMLVAFLGLLGAGEVPFVYCACLFTSHAF